MKLLKYLLAVVLLACVFPPGLEAQSMKAYLKKAQEAYNARNYSTSLAHYRTILSEEPNRLDALYYAAESARRLRSYKLAEQYFETIPDTEKRGPYELTDFWLATVKKGMEKFDEASVLFTGFMETHPENTKYYRKSQDEIENCDWALEMVQNPLRVEITQLAENVNTYFPDYAPFLVGDTLYYSSTAKVRLDKSKKKKKKRKKRKKKSSKKKKYSKTEYAYVTKIFKAVGDEKGKPIRENSRKANTFTANIAMNTMRTRMYYSVCEENPEDGAISCELYYRDRSYNGSWERARPLPAEINLAGYKTTQPALGIDMRTGKEILFFASDRMGGQGLMDIWYCFVEGEETFSTPQNLRSVNSANDELSPFFDTHSQTLYFSSDGFQNLGGYDLFKSTKKDNEWSAPENLGYPINTSYDDMYYSFDVQSGRVFIASNRPGSLCVSENKDCNLHDIYELTPNMDLVVSVFNEIDFSLQKGASIKLIDKLTGEEELIEMGEEEFYAHIALAPGRDYDMIVNRDGFEETTTLVSSKNFTEDTEPKKYVFMKPQAGYVAAVVPENAPKPEPPVAKKPASTYTFPKPVTEEDKLSEVKNVTEVDKDILAINDPVETPKEVVTEAPVKKETRKTNYPPKKNKTNYPPKRSKTNYPPQTSKTMILPKDSYAKSKSQSKKVIKKKDNPEAMLVGTRSGFDVATGQFTVKSPAKEAVAVTVAPANGKSYSLNLPITIYFDNNYPRASMDMNTLTYKRAYKDYISRQTTYVTKYPSGLIGIEKELAKKDVNDFFNRRLQGGYFELMEFTENLLYHLERGEKIELSLEGYASPIANAAYNSKLTNRRLQTIMNHFNVFSNGALKKYFASKDLVIRTVPFGETQASRGVSDDYSDKRSSVYSPRACMERRVTITGKMRSGGGVSSK